MASWRSQRPVDAPRCAGRRPDLFVPVPESLPVPDFDFLVMLTRYRKPVFKAGSAPATCGVSRFTPDACASFQAALTPGARANEISQLGDPCATVPILNRRWASEMPSILRTRSPRRCCALPRARTVSSMVKAMYRKHSRAPSRTDFHEFPHLSHWLIAGSGREEVADKALKLAEVNPKPVGRASNAAWIFSIIGRWCEPVDAPLYVKECKVMGHAIRQGFPVVAPTSPSLSARSVAEQDLLWGQS